MDHGGARRSKTCVGEAQVEHDVAFGKAGVISSSFLTHFFPTQCRFTGRLCNSAWPRRTRASQSPPEICVQRQFWIWQRWRVLLLKSLRRPRASSLELWI